MRQHLYNTRVQTRANVHNSICTGKYMHWKPKMQVFKDENIRFQWIRLQTTNITDWSWLHNSQVEVKLQQRKIRFSNWNFGTLANGLSKNSFSKVGLTKEDFRQCSVPHNLGGSANHELAIELWGDELFFHLCLIFWITLSLFLGGTNVVWYATNVLDRNLICHFGGELFSRFLSDFFNHIQIWFWWMSRFSEVGRILFNMQQRCSTGLGSVISTRSLEKRRRCMIFEIQRLSRTSGPCCGIRGTRLKKGSGLMLRAW